MKLTQIKKIRRAVRVHRKEENEKSGLELESESENEPKDILHNKEPKCDQQE